MTDPVQRRLESHAKAATPEASRGRDARWAKQRQWLRSRIWLRVHRRKIVTAALIAGQALAAAVWMSLSEAAMSPWWAVAICGVMLVVVLSSIWSER